MSSYGSSGPRSSHEQYPHNNAQPQYNQHYNSQPQPQQQHQYQPPQVNPDAIIPHPTHHQSHSHHPDPYLQPHSQQPPYSRHASHQSHHSHHSHHSHPQRHDSDDSSRYDSDRDYERRPTFGDTLSLVWHTLVGAITGKRR